MGIRGDFDNTRWPNWFALVFDHSIPVIVMTMEWTHNSIKVEWNRYPFYLLAGYIYILILMVATYVHQFPFGERSYASMDFYNDPWAANFAVVGVFGIQALCYWFVAWATR
jgi:hypothetical protein